VIALYVKKIEFQFKRIYRRLRFSARFAQDNKGGADNKP